jgi:hypothetical protein
MLRNSAWVLGVVMFWSGSAVAQFCPAGSRQVQNGYQIMCMCPDGSAASYQGCPERTLQAAPQATQRTTPVETNAPALDRLISALDNALENGRINVSPGDKVSSATMQNSVAKPSGYDYTPQTPQPNTQPKPNNVNQTAGVGAILNGAGVLKPVDGATPVNQWTDKSGGASQINAFTSPSTAPATSVPPAPKTSLVGQFGDGVKQIGKDIVALPSNVWKLGTAIMGGDTKTANPTTTNSPLFADPTNISSQSNGSAKTTTKTQGPESVAAPMFGVTSTFNGPIEIGK